MATTLVQRTCTCMYTEQEWLSDKMEIWGPDGGNSFTRLTPPTHNRLFRDRYAPSSLLLGMVFLKKKPLPSQTNHPQLIQDGCLSCEGPLLLVSPWLVPSFPSFPSFPVPSLSPFLLFLVLGAQQRFLHPVYILLDLFTSFQQILVCTSHWLIHWQN